MAKRKFNVHVVKSRIKKAEMPTQLVSENVYAANDWLDQPVDMLGLRTLVDNSSILPQCIRAYRQNICGFGIGVRYVDDVEENPEAEEEFKRAEKIIELLNTEQDTKEVFEDVVEARETYGIAYLEVIRNMAGEVVQVEFIKDTPTVVKTIPLPPYVDTKYYHRGEEVDRKKKFCKYKQEIAVNTVYYKEFGDPRIMDNRTGEYVPEDESLDVEFQANEILEFPIGTEPYGKIRWIGQVLGVDGTRRAEGLNNNYFENGRHTPLMIIVRGGYLTDDSYTKLQQYMDEIKGENGQHAFMVLEAEGTEGSVDYEVGNKPDIEIKELAGILQKDELFQEYINNGRRRVQSAFQLPDLYVGYTTDFNRATAQSAQEVTEEQVFQPERKSLAWVINNRLLNEYAFKYVEAYFLEPDVSNPDDLTKILSIVNAAGGLTPNKAKEILFESLGEVAEDYPDDWGNVPLAVYSMQQAQQAQPQSPFALSASLEEQIEKAAKHHDDEIVAVMKEVKKQILQNQGFTTTRKGAIIHKDTEDANGNLHDEAGQFSEKGGGSGGQGGGQNQGSRRYDPEKIKGTKVSTGETVKGVSRHAQQRMKERHISANKVIDVLSSEDSVVSTSHTGTTLYDKGGYRVAFNRETGIVVTCIWRGKR